MLLELNNMKNWVNFHMFKELELVRRIAYGSYDRKWPIVFVWEKYIFRPPTLTRV